MSKSSVRKSRKRKGKDTELAEFRSGLERRVAEQLKDAEVSYIYEGAVLPYIMGGKVHRYTPDFKIGAGIFIETKGRFVNLERDSRKLILVRQQHPEIELRIVFQRENQAISREEATTYAEWAEANGFVWAGSGTVPEQWLHEFQGRPQ